MVPDAEAYRRREIGSKRMEEEAKKIQPLRPLSAADTDLEYLSAASGGQIDMDRMRLELMNKGGLSKQERRANRKKFMEPSKDKRRFYHGSKEPNIVEFKTRKQIADENYPDDPSNDYRDERNAVFLSPDPKFTRHFSVEGYTDTGQAPTTYPVHVQARNPFDFDNAKHRENLWKTYHDIYYNPESELYAHGPHDTASEKTLAEMRMKKRIYESHKDENNWPLFENPNVQEAIQDMGHDSFYIKERGTKNLGVYDPRRIKSAIGNRGTYDINDPDITKAKGGQVKKHNFVKHKRGEKVGGYDVGEKINNYGSYASSGIDDVEEGIHRVPMSAFEVTHPNKLFYAKNDIEHVHRLADQIRQNKYMDPLLVAMDKKGAYVLEGGHRLGAAHLLGMKEIPAMIGHEPEDYANGGITHAHHLNIEERPL
jgi:hypothetical protein